TRSTRAGSRAPTGCMSPATACCASRSPAPRSRPRGSRCGSASTSPPRPTSAHTGSSAFARSWPSWARSSCSRTRRSARSSAGEGAEVGRESERRVRAAGAVPATIGILDGKLRVGLTDEELRRFDEAGADARKVGPRDLGAALAQNALGATTVGGTLAAMRVAGIGFMGTGGLGGVHRGFPDPPDVSADLAELARAEALVVSAGVKSLLDVPATMELLETLGVPVLGYRTDELPLFFAAAGVPPVSARVASAEAAA